MLRRLALLCLLPVAVAPAAVVAQVRVNPGALDSLVQTAPEAAPAPAARAPVPRPAPVRRPATLHKPAAPAAPKRPAVAVAPAPPPPPVLAPPAPPPPARPVPAPSVPLSADAAGEATPLPGGVRVTFAPGKAELNPATAAALRELGRAAAATAAGALKVQAYAAGTPDDPSTPRRVSLSRALAARAVLLGEGLPSARIYVYALGVPPSGPADRVDVQPPGAAPAPPDAAGAQKP